MSTLDVSGSGQDFRDAQAKNIVSMWDDMNHERKAWMDKGLDARRYVSATSTDDTDVGSTLPWKNKTTIPKLTQIVDNLHAFYMAALMPTDDWFRFEGVDAESHAKAQIIERYMRTKLRMGGFRKELEKIVRDWIMYGNCFAGVTYVNETSKSLSTGEEIVRYRGPKLFRVSPLDCVIDKRATSFKKSPYIRRRLVPTADILTHNEIEPEFQYSQESLDKILQLRTNPNDDWTDFYINNGLNVDGFTTFDDYLSGQYIELLEFYGDILNRETGEVERNRVIIIADRAFTLYNGDNPAWSGEKPFAHAGWRILPDNLYGQSPIENLVGMQYRCDHLENSKADAFDQIIHPMMKIKGDEVEDFDWRPGGKVYVGYAGDIEAMRPDTTALNANNEIAIYHNMMEQMAGSPREMMGFRTPGEKTAFEVNILQQGADRMFQDKLNRFEEFIIEPVLNLMFEMAVRNFDAADVARTFNDDTRALELMTLTKEDVVADGTLRPVGAKHFAARNKRVQELQQLTGLKADPQIGAHMSGKAMARAFEEELGYEQFGIFEDNIAVIEQAETLQLTQQLQSQLQAQAAPVEGEPGEDLEESPS
jgi:hypothetical protein